TLCHLLWGDQIWMSRFDGWPAPGVKIKESAGMIEDFAELSGRRVEADEKINAWAAGVDETWLGGDMGWFSQAAGKELRQAGMMLVTHFFNHQTHHGGQVHALLTAAGEKTGDTDLFLVV